MPTSLTRPFASLFAASVLAIGALVTGGCADYGSQMQSVRGAWVAGDNARAAALTESLAEDKQSSGDAVVFGLESGAALRAAGLFEQSNAQFALTENKINSYEAGADVRLAAEAGASLSNLSFLPYTGTAYDKVMLSTYQTLNDLQQRNYEAARVNLNRALEYQRQAVRDNAAAIEAADSAAKGSDSADLDVNATRNSQQLANMLADSRVQTRNLQAYADYVNPFSVLLDGLFHLYQGVDFSDLDRARTSLERVRGMVDATTFIDEDLRSVQNRLQGKAEQTPLTYVIFETGMAARLEQVRIDLPLFIFGLKNVPYVGVAFPKLVADDNYVPHLVVTAGGARYTTLRVCRMDSVIARDFENAYDLIVTKTILSAGVKAAATYALAEAGRQAGGDTGNLLGNLILAAGTAYQVMMNQADLRSWQTLPKYFEYARLPTPADHKLTLTPSSGGHSVTVELEPAAVGVVYVKSNSRQAPLSVFQFPLKD